MFQDVVIDYTEDSHTVLPVRELVCILVSNQLKRVEETILENGVSVLHNQLTGLNNVR